MLKRLRGASECPERKEDGSLMATTLSRWYSWFPGARRAGSQGAGRLACGAATAAPGGRRHDPGAGTATATRRTPQMAAVARTGWQGGGVPSGSSGRGQGTTSSQRTLTDETAAWPWGPLAWGRDAIALPCTARARRGLMTDGADEPGRPAPPVIARCSAAGWCTPDAGTTTISTLAAPGPAGPGLDGAGRPGTVDGGGRARVTTATDAFADQSRQPRRWTRRRSAGTATCGCPEPVVPIQAILAEGGRVLLVPEPRRNSRATGPGCPAGKVSGPSKE